MGPRGATWEIPPRLGEPRMNRASGRDGKILPQTACSRTRGSSAPEILLDDPRGLPLVRLALEVVEPNFLRLRLLHRKRLLVAELILPGPHQGGQACDLQLVAGLGGAVPRLLWVGPQVEQLPVIDLGVDDELPPRVAH